MRLRSDLVPKDAAMLVVIGPVLTRDMGYVFDSWSPVDGLRRGYVYRRAEDAYYARKFEITSRSRVSHDETVTCGTLDDFMRSTAGALRQ
jgi:hypothetical protein